MKTGEQEFSQSFSHSSYKFRHMPDSTEATLSSAPPATSLEKALPPRTLCDNALATHPRVLLGTRHARSLA